MEAGPVPAAPLNRSSGIFSHFRADFLASIVVFLVALPLCMGIALASGAPIAAGIITGILGGIVVGAIGGSPIQVSGPAAGLSVLVFQMVEKFGWSAMGPVIVAAGLLQVLAGAIHWGQWFRAVSPAVIQGMLAGIGVVIVLQQFHVMFDDVSRANGIANLQAIPQTIGHLFDDGAAGHDRAAILGVCVLATIILWKSLLPKLGKYVSGPLVGVVVGGVIAYFMNGSASDDARVKLIELPQNFANAIHFPRWSYTAEDGQTASDFGFLFSKAGLVAALTMAFIASAETLLCASAVDRLHNGPKTKYDRELAAQGVGNALAGALGGLPMTGVIVRSSANVEAGGRTQMSAILHGIWLLVFVAILPSLFSGKTLMHYIPTSALAAVLVFTGYKLVDVKAIRELAKFGKWHLVIYFTTLIMIVVTDLLTGVLVGMGLSILRLLLDFSHLVINKTDDPATNTTRLEIIGAATFLQLPKFAAALESVPPSRHLHIDIDKVEYFDHACLDLMMGWEKQHAASGGSLLIDWEGLSARFQAAAASNGTRDVRRLVNRGHHQPKRHAPAKTTT
jgi:MFS superfamily sulfate permease-like transporter